MPDVRQFVHHHIIDGLLGLLHAVSTAATAKSFLCAGDFHSGGCDAHEPAVIVHPLPNVFGCLFSQRLLLFRRHLPRKGGLLALLLCLYMFVQPGGVLFHKRVDFPLWAPPRRAHHYLGVGGNFQRQGLSVRTDEGVGIHNITSKRNCKRLQAVFSSVFIDL